MATQSSNVRLEQSGRNSSSGVAVLDRPKIQHSTRNNDQMLQEEIARLVQASQEGRQRAGEGRSVPGQ